MVQQPWYPTLADVVATHFILLKTGITIVIASLTTLVVFHFVVSITVTANTSPISVISISILLVPIFYCYWPHTVFWCGNFGSYFSMTAMSQIQIYYPVGIYFFWRICALRLFRLRQLWVSGTSVVVGRWWSRRKEISTLLQLKIKWLQL
jgi:hypothetical protein